MRRVHFCVCDHASALDCDLPNGHAFDDDLPSDDAHAYVSFFAFRVHVCDCDCECAWFLCNDVPSCQMRLLVLVQQLNTECSRLL